MSIESVAIGDHHVPGTHLVVLGKLHSGEEVGNAGDAHQGQALQDRGMLVTSTRRYRFQYRLT